MGSEDPKLDALRKEGYQLLNRAIDEAGDQLRRDWWFERDPDLDSLRDADQAEWRLLERRSSGRQPKPAGLPGSPWQPLRGGSTALLATAVIVAVGVIVWFAGLALIAVLAAAALSVTLLAVLTGALRKSSLAVKDHPPGRRKRATERLVTGPPPGPGRRSKRRRGPRPGPDAQAAVDLRLGRELLRSGDRVTAEGALRSAAGRGRADAALELGTLLARRGDLRGATAAYELATTIARKRRDQRTEAAAAAALARVSSKPQPGEDVGGDSAPD